jgi:hypothetical protein
MNIWSKAMSIKKISTIENEYTYEIKIKFTASMLDSESGIQDCLNELGTLATTDLLETFDSDGSQIIIGSTKLMSKGKVEKEYQTPYGVSTVARHVYQTNQGGKTFCPLDQNARIVVTSTPRFAKQISHKFAENASPQVREDLSENHNRHVARSYLQNVADAVGSIVEAKEEDWSYMPPELSSPIHHVGIGLDGTCMLLCNDGYRETMVGTIALYDRDGARLHTTYIAASPEYGKATFKEKLDRLNTDSKRRYPSAKFIGIADGAKENWTFLDKYTDSNTLDFWHATEYLTKASQVVFPRKKKDRKAWFEEKCHELKHKQGAVSRIIKEVETFIKDNKINKSQAEKAKTFLTYFKNNKPRMNYGHKLKNNEPIGSGVTEAACKLIVKQRLCKSGAKWKDKGARTVLNLRALRYSTSYWQQFWNKVGQYGFSMAA